MIVISSTSAMFSILVQLLVLCPIAFEQERHGQSKAKRVQSNAHIKRSAVPMQKIRSCSTAVVDVDLHRARKA